VSEPTPDDWRSITDRRGWCMGANDHFGTCYWVMLANFRIVNGFPVMPDGEIENAAREMEGFNPYDPATDHGENLEAGFNYINEHGWPGDPTQRIGSWREVTFPQVAETIALRKGVPAWLMLPMTADRTDYDFTDDALVREAPGVHPHAVLVVYAAPEGLTFITWANPQGVSARWAETYFKGFYDIRWTDLA
jgi:hypothetical protein